MTKTRYDQKYKYDLNQNRWPLKVKHSNSIWLMGVKPQTAPFSFLWLRNAAEMLPQLWCSTLPSQCVSVFPMHIIRHLKGKQCIFTRHASLCAQTGAVSAETGGVGGGGCIVIDCYKRLPSSRSIKLFQNCIWCLRAPKKALSAPHISTDMQFAKQLPWAVVWSLSPLWYNSLCSHKGNHDSFQELSVMGDWNEYFLHMFKNCNRHSLLPPKWRGLNDNDIWRCSGSMCFCSC